MSDPLTKALIAAVGVVGGAFVTAIAAAYSARQKIRELELTYEQRLKENYLANARQYIEGVYAPLSIALTELSNAYRAFRARISFDPPSVDPTAESVFRDACQHYDEVVSALFRRGADAFLTTALDEQLQSFNAFIRDSLPSTEPVLKLVVGYSLSLLGIPLIATDVDLSTEARGRWARRLQSGPIRFRILGSGFTYRANELLSAPLASREFEERIGKDIPTLKFLIKEVTLGSQSKV